VIGSRFRVQGSKVIVYFTRVQGSPFRVDNPWPRPLAQTWHERAEFYGLYTRSITVAL